MHKMVSVVELVLLSAYQSVFCRHAYSATSYERYRISVKQTYMYLMGIGAPRSRLYRVTIAVLTNDIHHN